MIYVFYVMDPHYSFGLISQFEKYDEKFNFRLYKIGNIQNEILPTLNSVSRLGQRH
jgi:hypothetical protein